MREQLRSLAADVPDVPDDRSYAQGQTAAVEFMNTVPREAARGLTECMTYIGSGKFAQGFEATATKLLTEAALDFEFGEHVYERLTSFHGGDRVRERVRTLAVRW